MRVRLERYERENRSAQTRSLLAFVLGGIGVVFFGFLTFLGALMTAMPEGEGGGLWERRAGLFLGLFMGVIPAAISGLVITWGARQRSRFRRFGELAAIARQTPVLTTAQIAHALHLTPVDADGLVLEASSFGLVDLIEHGVPQHIPGASTPPPPNLPAGSTPPPPNLPAGSTPPPPDPLALAPTITAESGDVASDPTTTPGTASGEASSPIGYGSVLGGAYRIEEPLGAGGMGVVHAARHVRTGRRYAVKTILAGANASEAAIRRFEREATAASALAHPGIVQVHDFNVEPGGFFYLVMDLLEGETLASRLRRASPLPWRDAQRIALELCAALGAAHEHGLLHRDIKPSNVFLTRPTGATGDAERTVLVDFGLVKHMNESGPKITSTGAVIGTLSYMSPEQARGEALDARSDLYSLAAVVFETITGRPPFRERTMAAVYARLLGEPPPRPSDVARTALPRGIDDVLLRALARDRTARFPSARALGEALASVAVEGSLGIIPATERMPS